MKIAVVGFGNWGEILVNSLFVFKKDIDYLCVVDIDKRKREKAKKYRLDFFTDLRQVYKKVDAFIIATWEHTHYKLAKRCLLNKKHVLSEKPLATASQQAKELVEIAQKNRLTLMVESTFLFDKSFLYLERKIDKGQIGKLLRIDSFRFSPNIIKPFTNVVVDLFPHDTSIFYTLLKKQPQKIEVNCETLINKYCDNAQIAFFFDSVMTKSFLSWTHPFNRREMIFYGSKGIFLWRKKDSVTDIITQFRYDKGKEAKLETRLEIGKKNETLKLVLNEFFRSIRLKKEPKTSGKKTLPEVKILEKVLRKV